MDILVFTDKYPPKGTILMAKVNSGKKKGQYLSIDPDGVVDGEHYNFIDLKSNTLDPVPDFNRRLSYYIAAKAGAGKSTYASRLVKWWHKKNPKSDIFMFSRKPYKEDPAYKKYKIQQFKIDDRMISEPLNSHSFPNNSLVIFDDVSTIGNKQIKDAVFQLMADIMEVGRARKIYVIITNHLINPNNRKFGRTVMNEANFITLFPGSNARAFRYALREYVGMDNKDITKLIKLGRKKKNASRWITVHNNFPLVVFHEHGAFVPIEDIEQKKTK
jgi:hypothetical protein